MWTQIWLLPLILFLRQVHHLKSSLTKALCPPGPLAAQSFFWLVHISKPFPTISNLTFNSIWLFENWSVQCVPLLMSNLSYSDVMGSSYSVNGFREGVTWPMSHFIGEGVRGRHKRCHRFVRGCHTEAGGANRVCRMWLRLSPRWHLLLLHMYPATFHLYYTWIKLGST